MSMYVRQGIVVPDDGSGKSWGGPDASVMTDSDTPVRTEREQSMLEHTIGFDGLRYDYHGYRYDRLPDALAYARLMRSRPIEAGARGSYVTGASVVGPSEAERKSMTMLAIRYEDGMYRFSAFRYDRLADAVNYARLVAGRKA
jgi:hypothetical protein